MKKNLNYILNILPLTNLSLWRQYDGLNFRIITDNKRILKKEEYYITTNYSGHILYIINRGFPEAEGIQITAMFE